MKPEFWDDDVTTGTWPVDEKLVYMGLISLCDDQGRIEWRPRRLRSHLFPYPEGALLTRGGPEIDFEGVVGRIEQAGRIRFYEANGIQYAWLPKFNKHQRIEKPTPSKLPPPPGFSQTAPQLLLESSPTPPGGLLDGSGDGTGEGDGTGTGGERIATAGKPRTGRGSRGEGDPRHRPLVDLLVAAFEKKRGGKYGFSREADPPAVTSLLKLGDEAEILRRWNMALDAAPPHRCDTIAQLASARIWNHFAPGDVHSEQRSKFAT